MAKRTSSKKSNADRALDGVKRLLVKRYGPGRPPERARPAAQEPEGAPAASGDAPATRTGEGGE